MTNVRDLLPFGRSVQVRRGANPIVSFQDEVNKLFGGEKTEEKKEDKEGYHRQERSYGSFQRVVALPDNANFDKAEANFKNGVLTLSVPKKAGAQSKERKIEIKIAA